MTTYLKRIKLKVGNKIKTVYGYCPNPYFTPRHNACKMLLLSPTLYLKNPSNTAFHNLCNDKDKLPKSIRSLLGLGLNFCPKPLKTSIMSTIQLERLKKDYFCEIMFAGIEKNEKERPKLYLPNPTWKPKEPDKHELKD